MSILMLYFLQQKLTETTLFGLKRAESGGNPQSGWRQQYLCSRNNKERSISRTKGNHSVDDENGNECDRDWGKKVLASAMNEIVTTY